MKLLKHLIWICALISFSITVYAATDATANDAAKMPSGSNTNSGCFYIHIVPQAPVIRAGEKVKFRVILDCYEEDRDVTDKPDLVMTSSDESVAKKTTQTEFEGLKSGKAIIDANYEGFPYLPHFGPATLTVLEQKDIDSILQKK